MNPSQSINVHDRSYVVTESNSTAAAKEQVAGAVSYRFPTGTLKSAIQRSAVGLPTPFGVLAVFRYKSPFGDDGCLEQSAAEWFQPPLGWQNAAVAAMDAAYWDEASCIDGFLVLEIACGSYDDANKLAGLFRALMSTFIN